MLNKLRPAFVIMRREMRDQFRDWRIVFPVIGLTLVFPFLMNFTAGQMLGFVEQYGASIIGERLVPFLMMVVGFFPISVSLVIALESFVGEKERGTIEPLLNTPLEDGQLYLGKLLAATISPLLSSYLGMAVYSIGLLLSGVSLPEPGMMLQIVALTTVQAVMMVAGAVVVSSQATSVRASNLLASFIVIPSALLIQGESVMMFWGNSQTLWWAVAGILVLTVLLVRVGLAHFQREELLGRQIDVLNLRNGWQVFRNSFVGGAQSLREWYFRSIPKTLYKMRYSILISLGIALVSIWVGRGQSVRFMIPLQQTGFDNLDARLQTLLKAWPLFSFNPVMQIWWQNLRAMLIGMVLGVFSFGILGTLPEILTLGITGYLSGLTQQSGLSLLSFLGFILPHGIFEIPALILSTAAVFHFGVILATPDPDRKIGEVWLTSLADWAKVMLGVVIPVLLVAAGIEAWLTPRLAVFFIH